MIPQSKIKTLYAVRSIHKVAGYSPTVGEVAKVACISRSTAYRHLQFLLEQEAVCLITGIKGRADYRFRETELGKSILSLSGRE